MNQVLTKVSVQLAAAMWAALAAGALISSCAPRVEPLASDAEITGTKYKILDGALAPSTHDISGSGILAFSDLIPGVKSDRHFATEFQLEDGGSIEIFLFSQVLESEKSFARGYSVILNRVGESLLWRRRIGTQEQLAEELPTEGQNGIKFPQGGAKIRLGIDVHNDHGHILFWISDASDNRDADPEQPFYEDKVGSTIEGGLSWGVQLVTGTLTKATTSNAIFKD